MENAVAGGAIGGLTIVYIILVVMLTIAPLMIWSKTAQMVKLLKEQNLYLRVLVKKADPTLKLPND